jgi:hypothetical protein
VASLSSEISPALQTCSSACIDLLRDLVELEVVPNVTPIPATTRTMDPMRKARARPPNLLELGPPECEKTEVNKQMIRGHPMGSLWRTSLFSFVLTCRTISLITVHRKFGNRGQGSLYPTFNSDTTLILHDCYFDLTPPNSSRSENLDKRRAFSVRIRRHLRIPRAFRSHSVASSNEKYRQMHSKASTNGNTGRCRTT